MTDNITAVDSFAVEICDLFPSVSCVEDTFGYKDMGTTSMLQVQTIMGAAFGMGIRAEAIRFGENVRVRLYYGR